MHGEKAGTFVEEKKGEQYRFVYSEKYDGWPYR